MTKTITFPKLPYSTEHIIAGVLADDRRVLLFGEPGIGKSTLAAKLACALAKAERRAWCIGADPGSPGFGLPGTVGRGQWWGEAWRLEEMEALCSLDGARFRLPLVAAVQRLATQDGRGVLFVDGPGVVRGVAGSELLPGLVEAASVDVVLVLARAGEGPPLPDELRALGVEVFIIQAAAAARRPSKRERTRERTRQWDAHLADAKEQRIRLADMQLIGTPPPVDVPAAWTGRQIAVLSRSRTVALGEIIAKDPNSLWVRLPHRSGVGNLLLVRDAQRGENGLLNTAKPYRSNTLQYLPPPDVRPYSAIGSATGPCPVARVGMAIATLVNGIFGDPLLHLRLQHQRRSLLFDLGEGGRLPGRVAHQVSDVFISHAHFDHIAGFLWLLRSRIGDFPACRVYGPPGLAGHIDCLVRGIHWDRVGEYGPRFEVREFYGEHVERFVVQAGRSGAERTGEASMTDGILLEEPAFRVRAVTLDHGIPVLAFAFEQPKQLNIRKDRLTARGLPVGPWLGELKRRIAQDEWEAPICLPDGTVEPADRFADDLVLVKPGQTLAYATDLADTTDNRGRLARLASGAYTFFCEAPFVAEDADQAARTGHLTARACGEIAMAAEVEHLIPFHFSRRYENEAERVYDEVKAVCSRVVLPKIDVV